MTSRAKDIALYISIGFIVCTLVIAVARLPLNYKDIRRWVGLTVSTAILFWYFVSDSRELLRKLSFWVLTALLLSIHLLIFGIILRHVPEWRDIWFVLMALELPVFFFFRNRLAKN